MIDSTDDDVLEEIMRVHDNSTMQPNTGKPLAIMSFFKIRTQLLIRAAVVVVAVTPICLYHNYCRLVMAWSDVAWAGAPDTNQARALNTTNMSAMPTNQL